MCRIVMTSSCEEAAWLVMLSWNSPLTRWRQDPKLYCYSKSAKDFTRHARNIGGEDHTPEHPAKKCSNKIIKPCQGGIDFLDADHTKVGKQSRWSWRARGEIRQCSERVSKECSSLTRNSRPRKCRTWDTEWGPTRWTVMHWRIDLWRWLRFREAIRRNLLV